MSEKQHVEKPSMHGGIYGLVRRRAVVRVSPHRRGVGRLAAEWIRTLIERLSGRSLDDGSGGSLVRKPASTGPIVPGHGAGVRTGRRRNTDIDARSRHDADISKDYWDMVMLNNEHNEGVELTIRFLVDLFGVLVLGLAIFKVATLLVTRARGAVSAMIDKISITAKGEPKGSGGAATESISHDDEDSALPHTERPLIPAG